MFYRTLLSRFLAPIAVLAVLGATVVLAPARAEANVVEPELQDTARLLGYMWGDGSYSDGVWDVNGPSGTASLIEELVERHGGTWVDRQRLQFRLTAPYDWVDWKDGLPDDGELERAAVLNPHFLAALMETEASVDGAIYDQSSCCVDGFTQGRLIALRDLLRQRGFSTAAIVPFNNVDSGEVTIGSSEWSELRSAHRFVCPTTNSAIRIPGGTNYDSYGNLQWFNTTTRWSSLVRTDCRAGQLVPTATALVGTCSVVANGDAVTIDWSFTLGNANIRRNGGFIKTVAGRDGSTTDRPGDGTHSYELRLTVFGTTASVQCGSVTVGGGAGNDGPCSATAAGGQVELSWDDFGVSTYQVRRNGAWAATVHNVTSTQVSGSVDDAWQIRYRAAGSVIDVTCADEDGNDDPCTVTAIGQGNRVEWETVAGVSTYQVRRDGGWLATVNNGGSYDDAAGNPNSLYQLRYRQNGQTITISC